VLVAGRLDKVTNDGQNSGFVSQQLGNKLNAIQEYEERQQQSDQDDGRTRVGRLLICQ
jgi:hypothetical protein